MIDTKMGVMESKFADIVWEREPITSSELVRIAAETFGWARTTTHTVIKRLCDKEIFVNNKGTVTALVTKDEFFSLQSRNYVESSFAGSLPSFIAAFTSGRKLTAKEAEEIRRMIDEAEEDGK